MERLSNNHEFEHVRATAEAAKITAERATRGVRALETSVKRSEHYATGSVIAVLCLLVVGGASGWFVNTQLKAQGTSIAELLGLQHTIDKLSRRLSTTEVAVSTISEAKNVAGQKDGQKGTTVPQSASASPAVSPANSEQASQIALLNDRIAALQAQHSADTAQLESLRSELSSVKSVIPADSTQDVASLRADRDRDLARIASLANQVDRHRSDFEVSQGQAREVVPGILMSIKSTDVGRQEVTGWLYLQHERRYVQLKNQGLLRPITVYGSSDKNVHDIVITRIRKSYAVGYVLSPKTESLSETAGN